MPEVGVIVKANCLRSETEEKYLLGMFPSMLCVSFEHDIISVRVIL